ncbi:MAG: membrane protein insertion efficiency factor YidD [bacterium]|nr:membrane protein insertion efficiency factor YidD [bacterium]
MPGSRFIPQSLLRGLDRLLSGIALFLVRAYQLFLSPFLKFFTGPGARCRFHPTCSQYAHECFQQHPFFIAFYLSARRLLRCHPFHPGGYDPVPPPGGTDKTT